MAAPASLAPPDPSSAPGDEGTAPTGRAKGRWPIAVGAALVAMLAGWGLGRRSLWIDEAISVGATNELVATWKGTGGTMALYYALLTPWSWISDDAGWLRGLSVLFVVAAIPFVWGASRRILDQRAAGLAVAFTAGSWLVVRYAQEARSYALVLLLTSISWWALVGALRSTDPAERVRRWRLFAVVTVLAPLAHGLAVLQFAAQVLLLAFAPDRAAWFRRLRPTFIGVAAVTTVLVAAGASDIASWIPPLSAAQVGDLVAALTGPGLCAGLVLGAASVLGTVVAVQRHRSATDPTERVLALVPVAWGLVPALLLLVLSVARPYLLARYVVGSAPGIALLWAFAVLGPRPKVSMLRAAVVLVPVVAALLVGQVDLHREPGDDWRSAAASVATEADGVSDAIAFPNPSVRSAFDHAWAGVVASGADLADPPQGRPTPVSPIEPLGDVRRFYLVIDPVQLPDALADGDHARVWLVDQEGQGFDSALDPFLADPAITSAFDVVGDRSFDGGIRVVLLVRR